MGKYGLSNVNDVLKLAQIPYISPDVAKKAHRKCLLRTDAFKILAEYQRKQTNNE